MFSALSDNPAKKNDKGFFLKIKRHPGHPRDLVDKAHSLGRESNRRGRVGKLVWTGSLRREPILKTKNARIIFEMLDAF